MQESPIGMFDSGIGGITIYKEVHQLLPNENIIYLADSKNAPYGEKSKQEIIDLSIKNTEFLLRKGCKLIVVACNTASTNAVATLRKNYDIPFIRVQPAIKPAALQSKTNVVGILATEGTLKSELLFETSQKYAQGVKVIEQIGDGLVSLIESGKLHSKEMTFLLQKYMKPMIKNNIDQLVLGCTHYPFLRPQLQNILGHKITILDSGEAIARQTKVILEQENLINNSSGIKIQQFYSNYNPNILQYFINKIDKNFKAKLYNF